MLMSEYSVMNLVAASWFLLAWTSYAYFAKYTAKRGRNLSAVLNRQRLTWMRRVVERESRITDAALVANLERNASFLASTSILVLAGLLTALGVVDDIEATLQSLPFYQIKQGSAFWINVKILVLVSVYVYAFFTLTWSMRQYGFGSVMIGSAPEVDTIDEPPELTEKFICVSSKVIDMAGHTYNEGLRAYYFSLAVLPWFISPWYFIVSTTLVVWVLYIREFHSKPFKVLSNYLYERDELMKKNSIK